MDRLIPSYGRRRGRKLHGLRKGLLETLLPKLGVGDWALGSGKISHAPCPIPNPLYLEIGFGSGEHLAAQAAAHPEVSFIGCEPYVDGVANLLKGISARELRNIRIFPGDARLLLEKLPEAALDKVFILFPDPWPKARHHKRRLIQQEFLAALARAMKPGTELLLATDHADYLAWILEQILLSPHFSWKAERRADWTEPPPGWVQTRYQEKAEREGRKASYVRCVRL